MEEKNFDPKKVVVLGASSKSIRYSHKAVLALLEKGHKVIAIGRDVGAQIGEVAITKSIEDISDESEVDTITIYLNANNQSEYEKEIIALRPNRVIFNPGAENMKFYNALKEEGIEGLNACTLVMLSIGTF